MQAFLALCKYVLVVLRNNRSKEDCRPVRIALLPSRPARNLDLESFKVLLPKCQSASADNLQKFSNSKLHSVQSSSCPSQSLRAVNPVQFQPSPFSNMLLPRQTYENMDSESAVCVDHYMLGLQHLEILWLVRLEHKSR